MTKPANEQPATRKPVITPYRVMWSTLGSLAVVYLGVAVFAPAWLGDLTPSAVERQRDDTQPQIMKLSADVSGLRASIARMQLDLDGAKSDAVTQATATKLLDDRLTEFEKSHPVPAPPPVADAAPALPPPAKDVAAITPQPFAPATVSPSAMPAAGPAEMTTATADATPAARALSKVPQADTTSAMPAIVTGSIEGKTETPPVAKKAPDTAISFATAVVKPVAKPKLVGIQIATDISLDGLRARWTELSTIHPDLLKMLVARYAPGGDSSNPNYNLVAGPIKSKADAKKICKELELHDVLCKVSEFKGDTL